MQIIHLKMPKKHLKKLRKISQHQLTKIHKEEAKMLEQKRLDRSDFCASCLKSHYKMSDGSSSPSVGEILMDAERIKHPLVHVFENQKIRLALEESGGCFSCKLKVKKAMNL